MTFVVKEIWRYPVKSMQGERLEASAITAQGIPYDRGWAVRDEKTQTIRGAKHLPKLLFCSARYLDGTSAGAVPHVEITLPGGERARSDDPAISQALGREVTLWPLLGAEELDHYRIKDETSKDVAAEWRRLFMLEPGEPLPDLNGFGSKLLKELSQYVAPLGTYFDAFPINVLTESSVRWLQHHAPQSHLDVRRFRPNFLLSNDRVQGLVEDGWVGGELRIGKASIRIASRAPRCVMTSHAQPGLHRDPTVIRTIVRAFSSCFSVYAGVSLPGLVRIGDEAVMVAGPVTGQLAMGRLR
jgi:uncharacterized protein YcbX